MSKYWLLKTEPDCYAYTDLEREGGTIWDGITNNAALKHLRDIRPGDLALIYHTGDERRAVGVAEVTSEPYPDPKQSDPKLVVVDVKPLRQLGRPVLLAEIKGEALFADSALVRQGRLSVVPLTNDQWGRFLELAGEGGR